MNAADMDVVYICKPGETNEELRHSLRSLSNLPHNRVWLVGYKPRWATNVEYLPTVQRASKNINTWRNWQAVAGHDGISEQFVLFNDDFYVTRPIEQVPALHRGPLDEMIAKYARHRIIGCRERAAHTRRLLLQLGRTPLFSYELHTPMVMNRQLLARGLDWLEQNRRAPLEQVSKRTFYGNYAQAGGEQASDIKVQRANAGLPETELPFLSTSPISWPGLAGGWVRRVFSQPSPHEIIPGGGMYRPGAHDMGALNER